MHGFMGVLEGGYVGFWREKGRVGECVRHPDLQIEVVMIAEDGDG